MRLEIHIPSLNFKSLHFAILQGWCVNVRASYTTMPQVHNLMEFSCYSLSFDFLVVIAV